MAGPVRITPVSSKHIGAVGKRCRHVSFILEGSRCVWFLGDATPLQWQNCQELPKLDVMIAPYAYASSPMGWHITKQLNPKLLVLLHLPFRNEDPAGLWPAVEQTIGTDRSVRVLVPELGQTIRFRD